MLNEKKIEKKYFSISEVAKMLDVNASLIRYWDKEFDILNLKKNSKGDRFFTKENIETLRMIQYLVKERGYKLDGAKALLKSGFDETKRKFEVIDRLKKLRSFLVELKEQL